MHGGKLKRFSGKSEGVRAFVRSRYRWERDVMIVSVTTEQA
jgi:hypothetical protein